MHKSNSNTEVVFPSLYFLCVKAQGLRAVAVPHSESEQESPSRSRPPLEPLPLVRDGPTAPAGWPPPCVPLGIPCVAAVTPGEGAASIPLGHEQFTHSVLTSNTSKAIHTVLTCIDVCVVMIAMHIATEDAHKAQSAHRKKSRKSHDKVASTSQHGQSRRLGPGHDTLGHTCKAAHRHYCLARRGFGRQMVC